MGRKERVLLFTNTITAMNIIDLLVAPFTDYAFMKRALAACVVLSLGSAPLGVFMTLRRMTLVGDAMSHAILPGVAVSFLVAGLSVWPMTLGGLAAGIVVALLVALLTRFTQMKEDAAFTLLYLLSLAGGVTLVSLKGSSVDLLHLLFGNILAIDQDSLVLITGASCLSLGVLAVLYRRLVIECFDPVFMESVARNSGWTRFVFFGLLMINLVASFQALGTLLALGLMILPAIAARFWTRNIDTIIPLSVLLAVVSSVIGLLASYYGKIPSGSAIVMMAGLIGIMSALTGRYGSAMAYFLNRG